MREVSTRFVNRIPGTLGLLLASLLLARPLVAGEEETRPSTAPVGLAVAEPIVAGRFQSVIRPSQVPEYIYVSPDVLLRHADAVQPLTPEGWIVTDRPVAAGIILAAELNALQHAEHLFQLRQYASRIRLAKTELVHLAQREAVYRYFNKTGVLLVDYQNTVLARQAAEELLRNLLQERMLYNRRYQLKRQHADPAWISGEEIVHEY